MKKDEPKSANIVTRAQGKVAFKGVSSTSTDKPSSSGLPIASHDKQPVTNATKPSTSKQMVSTLPSYSIIEQLKRTNAQISILELLKISFAHREILEQALLETSVPKDLDLDRFQSMVGHLTLPHYLSFSEEDDNSLNHPHNQPLHIEVMIHKHRVKCVLIDGGAGLNIYTYNLITQLGYSENVIDPRKKITIKAYDKEERTSKGLVLLSIRVGLLEKDVVCQVLDIPLSYNILLDRPWIHDMQAVPSTYHQCLKFPYNGVEVSISANISVACNVLKQTMDTLVPHNRAMSINGNPKDIMRDLENKLKITDVDMGGYKIEPILSLTDLPTSPKHYGRPSEDHKPSNVLAQTIYDGTFIESSASLTTEIEEAVVLQWLYKEDEDREPPHGDISLEKYGKG